MASASNGNGKRPATFATHIIAGGTAGAMEALVCQPLDTIKVRMQLANSGTKPISFIATGANIVQRETALGLYRGMGAVLSGIVPKMAIRFTSFETYKGWMRDPDTGRTAAHHVFLAGLGAGVTEAVAVVTPMEVVKIRLQSQVLSLADTPRYRNAGHAVLTIIHEEPAALYRGVSLTALRQATNQGVNFTAYQEFKAFALRWQRMGELDTLPTWQTASIGLMSGAMGPFSNAPIDTIKTRLQRSSFGPNDSRSAVARIMGIAKEMWVQEGVRSFYRGITPRILRVAPGQAVVFAVYERVRAMVESASLRG